MSEALKLAERLWPFHGPALNTSDLKKAAVMLKTQAAEIEALRAEIQKQYACIRSHAELTFKAQDDAERYQALRRGQKWGVVDGIGNTLRAEELDAAIDVAKEQGK